MRDLSKWNGATPPQSNVLEGRLCRLEPLNAAKHGNELFAVASADDAPQRHRWLPDHAATDRAAFQPWLDKAEASTDPLYFAVIDMRTGRCEGRQTFLRHDPANGVIEIGHILWGGVIARTPVTTEAFFLFAKAVFEDWGYRRFEWKCNNRNGPSKRAAVRFGMTFEGVFRQAGVVKGENRDTAWFSLLDHEWPRAKAAFEAWLAADNFDQHGRQKRRLEDIRSAING